MNRISYDKLVRDRIPDIIRAAGKKPFCHSVSQEEALAYLAEKLCEEAAEYRASRDIEELADVLEVVRAIALERGVTQEALEEMRAQKAKERGAFRRRIILEAVETAE